MRFDFAHQICCQWKAMRNILHFNHMHLKTSKAEQKSKYRQSWNDLQKDVCMEPVHQELFVSTVCVHLWFCLFICLIFSCHGSPYFTANMLPRPRTDMNEWCIYILDCMLPWFPVNHMTETTWSDLLPLQQFQVKMGCYRWEKTCFVSTFAVFSIQNISLI